METQGLRTVEALQYARLDRIFWNSVVQREILTDLPPAVPGRHGRTFSVDDLIALDIFRELLDIGVQLHIAGRLASDLRGKLRDDPRINKLHLVTVRNADNSTLAEFVKEPPAESTTLWIIHVAKARKNARKAVAGQNDEAE